MDITPPPLPPVEVITGMRPQGAVVMGSTVELMCQARTLPTVPISYSWSDPRGQEVPAVSTDGVTSITVSVVEDYGYYTCTATTDYGINYGSLLVTHPGIEFP
jgi:hypothetical protein